MHVSMSPPPSPMLTCHPSLTHVSMSPPSHMLTCHPSLTHVHMSPLPHTCSHVTPSSPMFTCHPLPHTCSHVSLLQMSTIPSYQERLNGMILKISFRDKIAEIRPVCLFVRGVTMVTVVKHIYHCHTHFTGPGGHHKGIKTASR